MPIISKTPWQRHVAKWGNCRACPLWETRKHIVFARGKIPCDVLFCGEAPGKSENLIGEPFVGPAGHLLDDLIQQAAPGDLRIAFTNLVCCIPLQDEQSKLPEPPLESIRACASRLVEFVQLCQPRLIVLTGTLAKKHMSGDTAAPWLPYNERLKYIEITHPAAILRAQDMLQRGMKRRVVARLHEAFEDLLIPF